MWRKLEIFAKKLAKIRFSGISHISQDQIRIKNLDFWHENSIIWRFLVKKYSRIWLLE